ncbi:MAG: TatD family hydrolase [Bacillota bacterium]|nr:TatD family hydrolase [Bacillota bacterium]
MTPDAGHSAAVLFDTHAHLAHADFAADREEVLKRARAAGVRYILNAGWDLASSAEAAAMADPGQGLYAAVGIHPHDAARAPADYLERLRDLARRPGVVALGEIGLDYHYDFSPRDTQRRLFAEQLALAGELGLPVLVHDREAHADTLAALRQEAERRGTGTVQGVMHCYSGSREMAADFLGLGLLLGVGGPLTFANARRVVEVAEAVPLSALVIETDCPYLAPAPYRGKRNEPAYVVRVAEALAGVRGLALAEVAEATTANARRMLGLDR